MQTVSRQRVISGLAAGLFGLVVVGLGGWWFTVALGVIVHLGLLEFFRMAQCTGIRPATKTTLVACQLLLISTQWDLTGGLPSHLASAVLPIRSCHLWLVAPAADHRLHRRHRILNLRVVLSGISAQSLAAFASAQQP